MFKSIMTEANLIITLKNSAIEYSRCKTPAGKDIYEVDNCFIYVELNNGLFKCVNV